MAKKNTRRSARSLAFQVLYGLSFSASQSLDDVKRAFNQLPGDAENDTTDAPQGFAWELVQGVWSNNTELDALITDFSHNWRITRMGRIELTILRIAFFEMLYRKDIPAKVSINEALELLRQFGEENARTFLNGILDATAKALESGTIESRA